MNNKFLVNAFLRSPDAEFVRQSMNKSAPPGRWRPIRVSGLCEGALPLFCAAISDSPRRTLILCPDDAEARKTASFISSLDRECAFYPARDYNFNNILASHEFEHERLAVLYRMMKNDSFTVVSTPAAAFQLTMPPEKLAVRTIRLDRNSPIDTDELAIRLNGAGYRRCDMVESCGQFALRGGIVDIYAPSMHPVRIELFGDEVDRMGYFSLESQRFTGEETDSIEIPPTLEVILGDEERRSLRESVTRQISRVKGSAAEQTLRAELDALENSQDVNFADKYLPLIFSEGCCLTDYADEIIVVSDGACRERADAAFTLCDCSISDMKESGELAKTSGAYMKDMSEIDRLSVNVPTVITDTFLRSADGISADFPSRHIPAYEGNTQRLLEDIASYESRHTLACVLCSTAAEEEQTARLLVNEGYSVVRAGDGDGEEIFDEYLSKKGKTLPIVTLTGEYFAGFELDSPRFAFLDLSSSSQRRGILSRMRKRRGGKVKKSSTEAIMSYADLNPGDYVVHEAYGIGQYAGIENLSVGGVSRDYILINYAGSDKLYLPVDQLSLVSKYIGASSDSAGVKLSKMGGADWNRAKTKAKAASREMAKELIELYARRRRTKGIAFSPDSEMSAEFAASFEYEETDGQLRAVEDIKADMEREYPMDRLLCGDVGYGKTEVALRAAFKAAENGYQTAILVPTTILALQHYQTLLSRMRSFPVSVDMVSRFRTKKQQEASLRKLKRGETDIIVGTHRLISSDVEFAKLGLVIIDEEQRFGVAQKEKLKKISANADVLTLTATPIPRTLNMAMGGIVDMSVLEEAPGMRSPVQTYVMEYDDAVIAEALRKELRRGGQTFYLYNSVEGVYKIASKVESMVPDARIAVAHGRMEREELEEIWAELVRGEIDVLVSTTIIETGVDVPNANTLIIENADRYGLSQLHQIRGRVGRSTRRAYAYFTYRQDKTLSEIAEKRLSAIREYAAFGAGFRIALRDLEIRGAGNLLGAEQHGHLDAVGYDMYIKLLSEAVLEEKGETVAAPRECTVDVKLDAFLSKSYITSSAQRMEMYKKIAKISTEEDYEDLIDELCDRFGEPPRSAVNLCRIARLRGAGISAGMTKITQIDGTVRFVPESFDPALWQRLAAEYGKGMLRVGLNPEPSATVKLPPKVGVVDFCVDLLKKYIQIRGDSGNER